MFELKFRLEQPLSKSWTYTILNIDFFLHMDLIGVPVEHPEEFESESVHSTGSGNEKSVHSCLRSDLT